MIPTLLTYVLMASGTTATTYGYDEAYCGSPYRPALCDEYAITSSGEPFHPDKATAALAVPNNLILRPGIVVLRLDNGPCRPIRLNDRKNERYVNSELRWDLSPAAVKLLGGTPSPTWSGKVHVCLGREIHGSRIEWEPMVAQGEGK